MQMIVNINNVYIWTLSGKTVEIGGLQKNWKAQIQPRVQPRVEHVQASTLKAASSKDRRQQPSASPVDSGDDLGGADQLNISNANSKVAPQKGQAAKAATHKGGTKTVCILFP